MKKTIILLAAILSFTACNKEKTCSCTISIKTTTKYNGQIMENYTQEVKKTNFKGRKKECKNYSESSYVYDQNGNVSLNQQPFFKQEKKASCYIE